MEDQTKCRTHTIPEVAVILGVGRNTAYDMAKSGVIPTIRLGSRLVVPGPALERMLLAGSEEYPAEQTIDGDSDPMTAA